MGTTNHNLMTRLALLSLILFSCIGSSIGNGRKYVRSITSMEVEKKGAFPIMESYTSDMCVKEIPFLLGLFHCFSNDQRITKGFRLTLDKYTLLSLKRDASLKHGLKELQGSMIYKLDSLVLYKLKKNRYKKNLCNFIAYLEPGTYPIPNTGGASVLLPGVLKGSIYYDQNSPSKKMAVYLHVSGIKLQLPGYAKTMSFGLLCDMDIGIAELEFIKKSWTARLLYVKTGQNQKNTKGWSFNISKCGKIRPYSR